MLKNFTILFFLLFGVLAYGQQSPQFSMYMLNKFGFNPAYAGLDNSLSITGVYRKQWVGLAEGPETQQVNAHLPFYFLRGGLGIKIENDLVGVERNTTATLAYNYWIPINKTNLFSIGIEAGIIQKSLDKDKLRTPGGIIVDGIYTDHNDKLLPGFSEGFISAIAPNVNFGVYFRNDRIDAGFSVTNLTEPKISLDLNSSQTSDIQFIRNYFLTLGLDFDLGTNWEVMPSILAKSDLIQTEVHFSTIIRYNDNIFGGASFRGYNSNTVDAIAFMAGFKPNERLTLAYSYDWTLSNLNAVSRGSHEIILNYNLNRPIGKGLLPKIIYNPRYK